MGPLRIDRLVSPSLGFKDKKGLPSLLHWKRKNSPSLYESCILPQR